MRAFLVILVTLSAAAQNAPVRKITYDSSGLRIRRLRGALSVGGY